MSHSDSVERFWAREPFRVDPDTIERELSRVWQAAGKSTDDLQPVTRACLCNAVFVLDERPGHAGAAGRPALERAMAALPGRLASRSLVLRTRPRKEGQDSLSSFISASCVLAGGGGKLVCAEEVTLIADEDGQDHLPSLVRALLVPGVPTAVIFGGLPERDRRGHTEFVQLADRLVTAVDWSEHPDDVLSTAKELFEGRPLYGMDLGWLMQSELRAEITDRFEPPSGLDWRQIAAIRIEHPTEAQASAKMLAGWLVSALGARNISKTDGGWQAPLGGDRRLALALDPAEHMGVTFSQASGPRTTVKAPDDAPPLEARLALALAARHQDRLFADALTIGALL